MEFIDAKQLFDKIKDMINSAEKSITVITKELSDEIAELLLQKASKGIKVDVITRDVNWADWLDRKKNTYGIDELRNYEKEFNELLHKINIVKVLKILLPVFVIITPTLVGILYFTNVFYIFLVPGVIIGLLTFLIMRRLTRRYENQLGVYRNLITQRETEIDIIRQEIQKNLSVKLNKQVGFTVILTDEKGIITPLPLNLKDNLDEETFYDELGEEKIKVIFSLFNKSS